MCSFIELLSWTVLFAAETLAIIAGNIVTVIVFWKMRSDFKKTYYLLINLSIADLTVGISALEITIAKYFLEEILSLRCPRREYLLSYIDVHRSRKILRNNVSFEPQNLNQTGLCPWCFVAVGLWYVSRTDQLLSRAPSRFSISPRCPSDLDISGRDRCVGR